MAARTDRVVAVALGPQPTGTVVEHSTLDLSGEDVVERFGDVPRRVVVLKFRQVRDVADVVAGAVFVHVGVDLRSAGEFFRERERFEDGGAVGLEADVPGGTWTASGAGLNGATFNPGAAPLGVNVLTYEVENGSCTNSANFSTEVLPILSVTLQDEDPFCVNSSGGNINADVDLAAEAVWSDLPNLVWSSDCGGCLSNNGDIAIA